MATQTRRQQGVRKNAVILCVSSTSSKPVELAPELERVLTKPNVKPKPSLVNPNGKQLIKELQSLLRSKADFACFHFMGASTPDGCLLLSDGTLVSFGQFIQILKWYSQKRWLFGSRNPHKNVFLVLDTPHAGCWVDGMQQLPAWEKEQLRLGILTYRNAIDEKSGAGAFSRMLLTEPRGKSMALMFPALQSTVGFDLTATSLHLGMDLEAVRAGAGVASNTNLVLAGPSGAPLEPPVNMPSAVRYLLNVLPWERSSGYAFQPQYRQLSLGASDLNPLYRSHSHGISISGVLPQRVGTVSDLHVTLSDSFLTGKEDLSSMPSQSSLASSTQDADESHASWRTAGSRTFSASGLINRLWGGASPRNPASFSRENSNHVLETGSSSARSSPGRQRHRLAAAGGA